jgi:septum formation protein
LKQIGLTFSVHPAHIPEDPLPGEPPMDYVARLAREKAEVIYKELAIQNVGELQVLGADTTVTLDEHILGKPENEADAARMLALLSGRTHTVLTGVALVTANKTIVRCESTAVTFSKLSSDEISAYVATGEPMDKAGAYAIQGLTARWIPRIDGCYFNVVGLPLALVAEVLKECECET